MQNVRLFMILAVHGKKKACVFALLLFREHPKQLLESFCGRTKKATCFHPEFPNIKDEVKCHAKHLIVTRD